MDELFGTTRSIVTTHYALITPASHVHGTLPGWHGATCLTLITPRIGAQFTQYLLLLAEGGHGTMPTARDELFLYVETGRITVTITGTHDLTTTLADGGYCYVPPACTLHVTTDAAPAHLTIFQRRYLALDGAAPPAALSGNAHDLPGEPFMGDDDARLQTLLPDTLPFDMAVNLFTFQPGTALPLVEMHTMEHGLRMVQGQGVYRLNQDWYPVQAGDVIWMAPFCPQWFVAMGKQPARYLYYKDVNRYPVHH